VEEWEGGWARREGGMSTPDRTLLRFQTPHRPAASLSPRSCPTAAGTVSAGDSEESEGGVCEVQERNVRRRRRGTSLTASVSGGGGVAARRRATGATHQGQAIDLPLAVSHMGRYAVEFLRRMQVGVCLARWRRKRCAALLSRLLWRWFDGVSARVRRRLQAAALATAQTSRLLRVW
jgi:hypothetical protein